MTVWNFVNKTAGEKRSRTGHEKKKEALVVANNDNLSLAIGKKGQNVRLASRVTHYKLDVKREEEVNLDEISVNEE